MKRLLAGKANLARHSLPPLFALVSNTTFRHFYTIYGISVAHI